MANIKISQLPSTFTLDGTELHVVVQGGVTKKILNSTLKADILADVVTPTVVTIYNSSGELFDTGVATTRDFLFETSDDATYNPLGKTSEFRFNGYYNTVGGWSTEAGTLGMKTSKSGLNKLAVFNMYSTNPTVEIAATDTTTAHVRKLVVDSDKLELSTTFISGLLRFTINTNGASIMDTRFNPFGLEYAADYSASLVSKDSSVPDVKTVKLLREDSNTWTTDTRPTAVAGKHGFNTTTSKFEGYTGSAWVDFH